MTCYSELYMAVVQTMAAIGVGWITLDIVIAVRRRNKVLNRGAYRDRLIRRMLRAYHGRKSRFTTDEMFRMGRTLDAAYSGVMGGSEPL